LPFAIAAQWLFCPNFVEYRGCVVVVKNGDGEGNLGDQKENVEHWFDYFRGDIRNTEAKANLLRIAGLFVSTDDDPYEQNPPALARSVARCWEGLLAVQFPDNLRRLARRLPVMKPAGSGGRPRSARPRGERSRSRARRR
jgi:hypothetical protein